MRLFILSILAGLAAAHAYEIRSNFQAYTPAHGDLKTAVGQGYIHYFDDNGIENLFGYEYPDPLYALRSLGSRIFGAPSLAYLPTENQFTEEEKKARYDHFFMWADKRYEAFRVEMDRLKSVGRKPSKDMMSQYECLGKIIQSRKYPLDSSEPAVKRLLDEHLRIWQEARLKVSQWQADRMHSSIGTKGQTTIQSQSISSSGYGGYKSSQSSSSSGYAGVKTAPGHQYVWSGRESYAPIGETADQKKAREEHIRIYNEQVSGVQKAEAEHLRHTEAKTDIKSYVEPIQTGEAKAVYAEQSQIVKDTPEVMAAKEEHQRLFNAVKQRDDLENAQTVGQRDNLEGVVIINPLITQELKSSTIEHTAPVMDTPEVIRAREEHLRLVNEAKQRVQAEGDYSAKQETSQLRVVPGVQQPHQSNQPDSIATRTAPADTTFIAAQQQGHNVYSEASIVDGQVQYTPEVLRAREEHFRLFNAVKTGAPIQEQPAEVVFDSEAEKYGEGQRIREEKSFLEEEERLRTLEEQRQREADRLLEENRIREEKRFMEIERLRLEEDEKNRLRLESIAEGQTVGTQTDQQSQGVLYQLGPQVGLRQLVFKSGEIGQSIQPQQHQVQQQQQQQYQPYQNNPFLYGVGVKSLSDESSSQVITPYGQSNFQFPAGTHFLNLKSPLIIRYGPDGRPEFYTEGGLKLTGVIGEAAQQYQSTADTKLKSGFGENIATGSTSGISYGSGVSSFTTGAQTQQGASIVDELEKARREHFRAHEIALEQLRLANLKDSTESKKDCI